jgi:hypothetical protein
VGDFCLVVCEVKVGGRWRSEQRRADGLEMPRRRQRAIGKDHLACTAMPNCGTAQWLPQVLRAPKCGPLRMTNARE